jgi:Uma2 family endonuclease
MRDVTVLYESEAVVIPDWVVDLESFRRWADSEDFPKHGRIWYLQGNVWVDMSKEQLFTHSAVKHEIGFVLTRLIKEGNLGRFFPDGVLLSNEAADIAGIPDAIFVSKESRSSGRVRWVEGVEEGMLEIEGSPDMVLEVISRSSVQKDTVVLRKAYWEAGVREYWLVNAREDPISLDIFRYGPKGYVNARKREGWVKSDVFKKSFRLSQDKDDQDDPEYTLSVR